MPTTFFPSSAKRHCYILLVIRMVFQLQTFAEHHPQSSIHFQAEMAMTQYCMFILGSTIQTAIPKTTYRWKLKFVYKLTHLLNSAILNTSLWFSCSETQIPWRSQKSKESTKPCGTAITLLWQQGKELSKVSTAHQILSPIFGRQSLVSCLNFVSGSAEHPITLNFPSLPIIARYLRDDKLHLFIGRTSHAY